MKTIFFLILLGLVGAIPQTYARTPERIERVPASSPAPGGVSSKDGETDSRRMEKDLQRLPWKQFKSVIDAIPQLKAAVEPYGPLGWQYIQANYKNYGWKKQIDKLDGAQKKRLAELIQAAKIAR